MFNEYDAARANLRRVGLVKGEIDSALKYSKAIIRAAIQGDEKGVIDLNQQLKGICTESGLVERLYSKPTLTFDEGAERIVSTPSPILIGITGKPACGKSTLLKYFGTREDIVVIDEFWPLERDYDQKKEQAEKALTTGNKVIVASCIINHQGVRERYHLINSSERRKENLLTRSRTITDQLRSTYFDAFELIDLVLFESEAVNAQFLIDSSRIKY